MLRFIKVNFYINNNVATARNIPVLTVNAVSLC